ncbi:MAG: MBL fold metallo-hydrolase [Chloroflexota bacterium]
MKNRLILFGTGSPKPSHERYQTSMALIVNGQPYVIDCGAGVMQRIAEAALTNPELDNPNLTRLFLTHLHPDHTAGLADFLISPWIMQRREPIHVYGPKGTKKLVEHLLEAYDEGINAHLENEAPTQWPFLYEVFEISDGEFYKDDNLTMTAFRVDHGVLETYGFEAKTADNRIVFSGDTCKNNNVIKYAKDCDLLVHESYSVKGLENSPAWFPRKYFASVHTSSKELGEIGAVSNPKHIVLNHVMQLGTVTDEEYLAEIREKFDGELTMGSDLDVFDIG